MVADRDVCFLEGVKVGENSVYGITPVLSSDGSRVIVASFDKDAVLCRWFDARTGKEQGRYRILRGDLAPGEYWPTSWFADDATVFGYVTSDCRLALVDCSTRRVCMTLGMRRPVRRQSQLRVRAANRSPRAFQRSGASASCHPEIPWQ